MVGRIIFGIIGIPVGIALMVYAHKVVDGFTGPIPFAEKYLGGGGSYSFLRLLGAFISILSMLIMFGVANFIYDAIAVTLVGIGKQPK